MAQKKREFVDFDDQSVPIGKRKVAFVKWMLRRGETMRDAKIACYRKFRREERS